MSNYYGGSEVLWSYSQAATTSVVSASAVTITAGWDAITIPPGYFQKLGNMSAACRLVIGMQLTATATVPTFSFGVAVTQVVPAAFATTSLLTAVSATNTPTAGTAYMAWLDIDIALRTLGLGAASTLVSQGRVRCPSGFASPFEVTLPASNASQTFATYDVQQVGYLWPYITLGAATAGNTVTCQWGKLYGET